MQERILALQWQQLRHDELYHKEIVLLPVAERMKHFTLHFVKYASQLLDAVERNDQGRYNRALVDAFIICLASANTLNLNLAAHVSKISPSHFDSLTSLGNEIACVLNRPSDSRDWLFRKMSRLNGQLAKACESLDHVEVFPFREVMIESICRIFEVVLADAASFEFDIDAVSRERLAKIETKNPFQAFYEGNRG